jgi:hypothetical protein
MATGISLVLVGRIKPAASIISDFVRVVPEKLTVVAKSRTDKHSIFFISFVFQPQVFRIFLIRFRKVR